MEKDKITVLKGLSICFPDGSVETVACKAYGLGPVGVSCFSTRSPSIELPGNHIATFIFANIRSFEMIWEEQ